jgi:hypothetical protein
MALRDPPDRSIDRNLEGVSARGGSARRAKKPRIRPAKCLADCEWNGELRWSEWLANMGAPPLPRFDSSTISIDRARGEQGPQVSISTGATFVPIA